MKSIFLFAALCFTQFVMAQAPNANFTISDEDLILCEGDCIYVTNNSTGSDLTYLWSFQGATPATYVGQNPGPICFPLTSGSTPYAITLVATNPQGVTSTLTQFVTVNQTPTMNLTLSDTTAGAYVVINDTTIEMYQNAYLYAEGTPAGGNLYWYPSGVLSDSILGCAPCVAGDSLTVNPFYTTNYVATYTSVSYTHLRAHETN
jgi:hypothetical protein